MEHWLSGDSGKPKCSVKYHSAILSTTNPHDLIWERTQASAVKGRRLTPFELKHDPRRTLSRPAVMLRNSTVQGVS
jgi:hypothetical protein